MGNRQGIKVRISVVLGTLLLVLAGAGAVTLAVLNSGSTALSGDPGDSLPTESDAGSMPSTTAAPNGSARQLLPPAAANGDRYVRNVTPGATCAPTGGRGFTATGQLMLCGTTASDSVARWQRS